jgi:hypothetical protein
MSGFTGTSKMRTARVEHRCGQCGRTISVGERHHYWSFVYDGSWSSERTCAQCDQFQRALFAEGVRDVDMDGFEVQPYLPDLTQGDVAEDPLMLLRYQRYCLQWDGQPYPTDRAIPEGVSR